MSGNRRSMRLKYYDYTQEGAYYISVCTNHRNCLFGNIIVRGMVLNGNGEIANKCWNEIPKHFPDVTLDEYVIMPNHIHGIINITRNVGAKNFSPLQTFQTIRPPRGTSKTIGSIVRGFKIGVTKMICQNTNIKYIWQRNFYEHVVHDRYDLARIREYIINNPLTWDNDLENPNLRGFYFPSKYPSQSVK